VLNARDCRAKIAKVICINVAGSVLGQDNYSNLHLLIKEALRWVDEKYEHLCDKITTELEDESHDSLSQRQGIIYSKPGADEINKNRVNT
jgi:hypothetical protein